MAEVKDKAGLNFDSTKFMVVKKVGKKGDLIDRHNHPLDDVLFTVVKGKVKVQVGDQEFVLEPGQILNFDGENYISAELLEDSQAFVTLIRK